MSDIFDILEQLEKTSGTNDKIAILKTNNKNQELIELLDAALNFDRKFYIKKFDEDLGFSLITNTGMPQPRTVSNHTIFMWLLSVLENRKFTGHDALRIINSCFHVFEEEGERKWYERVLLKDLKCNFGISSCQKAGIDIEEFEVMLAKDGKAFKKLDSIIKEGVYASPKLNGYRCLAICDHGAVTLHSRNGLAYENFPTIKATLEKLSANSRFILDGECMSDDFNKMQQTAMSSKSGKSVGDIKYHVFGWVDWDEWHSKNFKQLTNERIGHLNTWFYDHSGELADANNIVKVEHGIILTVPEMYEFEKECIAKGYEGAMGLPNIPYYLGKKSNRLFKFKTFKSWDCEVLSVYEGEGKNIGKMGGLVVLQENGKECGLGSGWSDDDREYIWAHPKDFIGKKIEVSFQELTPDGVMQFPSVIRWRKDK